MSQTILVTGGAGYIGSHTVLVLLEAGYQVVVMDDLSNASEESLHRVRRLTGKDLTFYNAAVQDGPALRRIFSAHSIDAVIHFAGLKSVGESVREPVRYYEINLGSTLTLLKVMAENGVKKLVFSSSATVYGVPETVPIGEEAPRSATNPYGRTKLFLEEILTDAAGADSTLRVALLRYFNPVGAHPSGEIGEDPAGIPNNLLPYVAQVAVGRLPVLSVYGNDYPTPDGTGVRDYIHVMDLAEGHVAALNLLERTPGVTAVNLGTGTGYSVLEMVAAFEKASGRPVPYKIVPRRPGDVAACYADPARARTLLGWRATRSLSDMVRDAWRWQEKNPLGYKS